MLVRVLLSLVLLFAVGYARAAVNLAIGCLPDSAPMSLAQVRAVPSGAWQPADPRSPFNHLDPGEWCRFVVDGADAAGAVVRFKVPSVVVAPVATLYLPNAAGDAQGRSLGVETPNFGRSRHPAVLIEARYLGQPIYLRFPTRAGPRGRLEAWSLSDFVIRVRSEQSFQMAVLASMAVLGLMAGLFAYQLGRRILLYLCLWVIAVMALRIMESGLLTSWVSIDETGRRILHAGVLTLAVVISVIFSDRYLSLRIHLAGMSRLLAGLCVLLGIVGVLVAIGMSSPLRDAYNLLIILQLMIIGGCALILLVRGDAMARSFVLGWFPALVMSVVRAWYFLIDVPMPGWLEPAWQISLLLAIFVLLLVTARATRDAEREMHVVQRAATHDALTGLPNRAFLFNALRKGIDKARLSGETFTLLFLDLDHFKWINDAYGHDAGDRCLEHFASTMLARLRAGDVLARLGGEEFVVLLPGASLEQAGKVSDDLRHALAGAPFRLEEGVHAMTVSIGVASLREYDDAESLLKRADAAVYRAKADGRNRTVLETALHPG